MVVETVHHQSGIRHQNALPTSHLAVVEQNLNNNRQTVVPSANHHPYIIVCRITVSSDR